MENNYTQKGINNYINTLKGYQGYIQMSDESISDIWQSFSDISFAPLNGFVYEAHFCNGTESIAIKQINGDWLVSKTSLGEVKNKEKDIQTYHAINGLRVKMAQIWEEVDDEFCENMPVLKLKKVVFVGFTKGDDK
jgi:CRISPR type III-associated protein (TIGR04423 family)